MSDELWKSVFGSAHSRLKNQTFGAFMLSWAWVNWKVFFITFSSSLDTEHKLAKLNELEILFAIPLLMGILLPPIISWFSGTLEEGFTNEIENKRLKARHELTKTKMGVEKMEGVFQEFEELKSTHQKIVKNEEYLHKENENFNLLNNKMQEDIKIKTQAGNLQKLRLKTQKFEDDKIQLSDALNKKTKELQSLKKTYTSKNNKYAIWFDDFNSGIHKILIKKINLTKQDMLYKELVDLYHSFSNKIS